MRVIGSMELPERALAAWSSFFSHRRNVSKAANATRRGCGSNWRRLSQDQERVQLTLETGLGGCHHARSTPMQGARVLKPRIVPLPDRCTVIC